VLWVLWVRRAVGQALGIVLVVRVGWILRILLVLGLGGVMRMVWRVEAVLRVLVLMLFLRVWRIGMVVLLG
jgi:hypothetical protein